MRASFLFLGTGASSGIPRIGCHCAVCQSIHSRNKRLRSAGLIRIGDTSLLIDVGPDFRQQALKYAMTHLDGLLLTHTHFDHVAGIDELRVMNFQQKRPFPCLVSKETLQELKTRYHYLFREPDDGSSRSAELDCHVLPAETGEIQFLGVSISYTSYRQGKMKVTGYRMGQFAYISDIRHYDDTIFPFLEGVDQLVLSALRETPSHVHFSLSEAVAFAERAKVRQTWLTHLSHAVDHETACRNLPASVQPGFDGQELFFEV